MPNFIFGDCKTQVIFIWNLVAMVDNTKALNKRFLIYYTLIRCIPGTMYIVALWLTKSNESLGGLKKKKTEKNTIRRLAILIYHLS